MEKAPLFPSWSRSYTSSSSSSSSSFSSGPPLPLRCRPYKKLKGVSQGGSEPEIWREEALLRLNGTAPVFLGEKLITKTDLDLHHNRILFQRDVYHNLMKLPKDVISEEEKKLISSGTGLSVRVMDKKGRVLELAIKYRTSNKGMVIYGKLFKEYLKNNTLRQDVHLLNLYAFREGISLKEEAHRLFLVLVEHY